MQLNTVQTIQIIHRLEDGASARVMLGSGQETMPEQVANVNSLPSATTLCCGGVLVQALASNKSILGILGDGGANGKCFIVLIVNETICI